MAVILVVEDDILLRRTLARRLQRTGHQVRTAATLALASTAIHDWRPDLAVLDISLPDGNSLDFLEAHREYFAGVVLVVMTAVQDASALERAARLGAVAILIKPFPHAIILELIDRHVGHEQPAES